MNMSKPILLIKSLLRGEAPDPSRIRRHERNEGTEESFDEFDGSCSISCEHGWNNAKPTNTTTTTTLMGDCVSPTNSKIRTQVVVVTRLITCSSHSCNSTLESTQRQRQRQRQQQEEEEEEEEEGRLVEQDSTTTVEEMLSTGSTVTGDSFIVECGGSENDFVDDVSALDPYLDINFGAGSSNESPLSNKKQFMIHWQCEQQHYHEKLQQRHDRHHHSLDWEGEEEESGFGDESDERDYHDENKCNPNNYGGRCNNNNNNSTTITTTTNKHILLPTTERPFWGDGTEESMMCLVTTTQPTSMTSFQTLGTFQFSESGDGMTILSIPDHDNDDNHDNESPQQPRRVLQPLSHNMIHNHDEESALVMPSTSSAPIQPYHMHLGGTGSGGLAGTAVAVSPVAGAVVAVTKTKSLGTFDIIVPEGQEGDDHDGQQDTAMVVRKVPNSLAVSNNNRKIYPTPSNSPNNHNRNDHNRNSRKQQQIQAFQQTALNECTFWGSIVVTRGSSIDSSCSDHTNGHDYHNHIFSNNNNNRNKHNPKTAAALMNLGHAQMNAKECVNAVCSFSAACKIFMRLGANYQLAVAKAMDSIGLAWSRVRKQTDKNHYRNAMEALEEAFRIRYDLLGPWHVDTVDTLNKIAAVHYHVHEYAEACDAYWEVFWVRKAIFGTNHPSVAVSAQALGNVFTKCGNIVDANRYYQLALQIYNLMNLPDEHPTIIRLLKDIKQLDRISRAGLQ